MSYVYTRSEPGLWTGASSVRTANGRPRAITEALGKPQTGAIGSMVGSMRLG